MMLIAFLCFYGMAEKKAKDLPPLYKKWLEEEVVYIILPVEREVFLKLETDRERDRFIDAFWKHRDPNPATPENEFKTERDRRLNYANHYFGREEAKAGWRTDRGRMYILLGEPNDIQHFEGKTIYQFEKNISLDFDQEQIKSASRQPLIIHDMFPFLNRPEPPKYELLFIMGKTYQNRQEFRRAIGVFEKAISNYGLNINLLNSVGECHFRLNETNEALAAWQKSLEISPDQPQIKKIVESLKEKK
jgi:GWxTD domain-containing protein